MILEEPPVITLGFTPSLVRVFRLILHFLVRERGEEGKKKKEKGEELRYEKGPRGQNHYKNMYTNN